MMPFFKMPKVMVYELIRTVSFYMNACMLKSSILEYLSLSTLVEGVQLDYNKHVQDVFGEYTQTFEGSNNTMKEQTIGAIALVPSDNVELDFSV